MKKWLTPPTRIWLGWMIAMAVSIITIVPLIDIPFTIARLPLWVLPLWPLLWAWTTQNLSTVIELQATERKTFEAQRKFFERTQDAFEVDQRSLQRTLTALTEIACAPVTPDRGVFTTEAEVMRSLAREALASYRTAP